MRDFEFYDFAGVLVPGTLVLTGIYFASPALRDLLPIKDMSAGAAGFLAVIAYATGQLVQAVGNGVEWVWWRLFGGMPTKWPRCDPPKLLSPSETAQLAERISQRLGFPRTDRIADLSTEDWNAAVGQMATHVRSRRLSGHLDVFDGVYGLTRGVVAALMIDIALLLAGGGVGRWELELMLVAALAAALFRMHRFGKHYARELFRQFLLTGETVREEQRERIG